MGVLICVSVTAEAVDRLVDGGPRRDFIELAAATRGRLLFRDRTAPGKGWRGRLAGPHLQQAWKAAGESADGDVIFADGEHIGIPLALFLRLRRRRVRVVMLGHFVSKPWKRALLALSTRLGAGGRLLVHSRLQRASVEPLLGRRWTVDMIPYQVDTSYWTPGAGRGDAVLAVGAESRDYTTLVEAGPDLGARIRIAAGSHWARRDATPRGGADGVEWIAEPLPFDRLRDEYRRAAVVVVPLHDVRNQSGVTTVLEAMSLALPVVVTATRGQREVIRGPLVTAEGIDEGATGDRGPAAFGAITADGQTGMYVPPGDPAALRRAISMILADRELADRMGVAGRDVALRSFSLEGYVGHLGDAIRREQRCLESRPGAAVPV